MWLTLIIIIFLSIILSRLLAASGFRKYERIFEKLYHVCKFSLIYPAIAFLYARRRSKYEKRFHVENVFKTLVPPKEDWELELPRKYFNENGMDVIQFFGCDHKGNSLFVSLTHKKLQTEAWLVFRLNGQLYTLPDHPQTVQEKYQNENRVFIGKGLRFELKEPCRKWRIWINTTVRKGFCEACDHDETNLVHLKLNGCLQPQITNQWGHLIAEVKIAGGESAQISFYCLKSRTSSEYSWNAVSKLNVHVAIFENGNYLIMGSLDLMDILKNISFGNVCWPDSQYTSITDTDLIYYDHLINDSGKFSIPFSSNGKHFRLRGQTELALPLVLDDHENHKTVLRLNKLQFQGQNGYGFNLLSSSNYVKFDGHIKSAPIICDYSQEYRYTSEEASLFILPLCHQAAKCSDLTGGKGCNLARLCELQSNFTVPTGFCVTTASYNSHVSEHKKLKYFIDHLHCYGKLSANELQEICEKIENMLTTIDLTKKLKSEIEYELDRIYPEMSWSDKKFAVRSSAVGEDSADLSTAGQLETYLQRQGLDDICEAVRLCWASQFRMPAVQYRRQHGQSLTSPVAVVIQEMVEPDASGVLFTNDPVSGDPLKIVINANPGLGELVVSGSVTPDTIILRRSYFHHKFVTWENTIFGETRRQTSCLDNNMAIKLGEIGIMVEAAYGGRPKDIEWSIKKGKIYLLQARDITSLETESEYDLMHEFDDASRNDDDCYTTANVGEVMAEPQTPLSLSVQMAALDLSAKGLFFHRGSIKDIYPYTKIFMQTYCNRTLFNMMETFYRETGHVEDTRILEICFMGRPFSQPAIKEAAVRRYGVPSAYHKINMVLNMMLTSFHTVPKIQEPETKRFSNYNLGVDGLLDAPSVYSEIEKQISNLVDAWSFHMLNSISSSFGYNFVAAVLLPRNPNEELTPNHYTDIATLFSSCKNVVSADVPVAMKKLAEAILSSGHSSQFRTMSPPEKAIEWLTSKESGEIGTIFHDFLNKHGHRSIAELDIGSMSWKLDPRPLVATLQNMLADEKSLGIKKEEITVDQAVKQIRTPINFIQRQILKLMVPFARTGVARREHSKNLAIKMTDVFRRGYRKLGKLLCDQGYLPDGQLIFYLSHIEIGDLIRLRPAKLVARAVRRRKLMKLLKTFNYPELIVGLPKPIELPNQQGKGDSLSIVIRGTPVSQGVAEGRVRVARRLDEAKDTQPGEILIATSTDIGWSPYFPMLSGVVTELGGLLSHGAVVAREYGLPCIVNAQNATNLFVTGDLARLNASRGVLEKL